MGKVEPVYFYNGVWEKKGKRMKFHPDINTRHLNLNLRLKRVVKGRHWLKVTELKYSYYHRLK